MKLAVLSDLHANFDALSAVAADIERSGGCDAIVVLGDLVDYGPEPIEVVEWVRKSASLVVRGNHDNAVATGQDCRCSPAFARLSRVTREYFQSRLPDAAIEYLRALPLTGRFSADGLKISLVHATPVDPLFAYLRPDAPEEEWQKVASSVESGTRILLVGHTHLPVVKQLGGLTVVNPGSVGQPKDGDPRAAYAMIEGGKVRLRRATYDVEGAIRRIRTLDLRAEDAEALCEILAAGGTSAH